MRLLFFLLLPLLTNAAIKRNQIDGKYDLFTGLLPLCAPTLRIRRATDKIQAKDLEWNGEQCRDGFISLTNEPTTANHGNHLIRFFREKKGIGEFFSGYVDGNIRCGSFSTNRRINYVVIMKPEEDFITTWERLYGGTGSLEKEGKAKFNNEYKYVFLADKCVYRAKKDKKKCFPGSAKVFVEGQGLKRMDELETGERVLVGKGVYSEVFAWTHRKRTEKTDAYVQIRTEAGDNLVLTKSHFVYANEEVVEAEGVEVGMRMRRSDGKDVRVVSVEEVEAEGLYNPQTLEGDIVVDGLVVTTYTKAVDVRTAHALLTPLRALWTTLGWGGEMDLESVSYLSG